MTAAERRLERPFGEVAMGLRGSTTNEARASDTLALRNRLQLE